MTVRWTDDLDRQLTRMFHAGDVDDAIAAAIPDATVHAVELRRSMLGLQRGMGPVRYSLSCPIASQEFKRRLSAEAGRRKLLHADLFRYRTDGDDAQIARIRASARQKTPFLEVAGKPAGLCFFSACPQEARP